MRVNAKRKDIAIAASLLAVAGVYLISRPYFLAISLLVILVVFTLIRDVEKTLELVYKIAPLLVPIYLIYTFFNTRFYSFDGLNYHIKYVLLLKDDFQLSFLELPPKPYVVELFLTTIWKLFGIRFMNLQFGLAMLAGILVYRLIFTELKIPHRTQRLALFIFLTAPTVVELALKEFKTDVFLLVVAGLCFNFFLKVVKQPHKVQFMYALGFLAAIGVLVKSSFWGPAGALLALAFVRLITTSTPPKHRYLLTLAKTGLVTGILFILPIITWLYVFGGTLPRFNYYIEPKLGENHQRISLTRDPNIYSACMQERFRNDYAEFLHSETLVQRLLQPLFYLTGYKSIHATIGMSNPGLLIYAGIFALLLMPLLNKTNFEQHTLLRYLYIAVSINVMLFFVLVGTVFWYLLPFYPFFALAVAYIADKQHGIIRHTLITILVVIGLTQALGAAVTALSSATTITDLAETKNYPQLGFIYEMNTFLEQLPPNKLILDASEHNKYAFTAFMQDADEKVTQSWYYFVASNKTIDDMHTELIDQGFKYIVVYENALDNFEWYKGCPRQNNIILKEFLAAKAKPIYSYNDVGIVFELVD